MKIGSIVRTSAAIYNYPNELAIVIRRHALKFVTVRVLNGSGTVLYIRGHDYDDLEVLSESR